MGIQNREGALFFATGIDNSGLRRGKQEAVGILKTFTRQVTGMDIFAGIGISATIALAKAGKEALLFSREFETAFAEVQTISESARTSADEMRESILQMTTEIPVGAVDSTKALYQIVSAGFDGAEAMNVLEISAKAAVAGVSTTATAADTITTIINAYGLSASDALNVSDALFKTVELGKTTLSEIGSSFSQVASISANYGIQLNEVLAALAAMTKQGTSTGEAITNIRQAIISVTERMGEGIFKQMSLAEAFRYSREEAEGSGEALREYYGRVQAVSGILQTTGENAHFLNDALNEINDSTGSTEAALAVMNATFDKQYQLLQNNIIVAFSDFGDELKENLIPLLIKFNDLMETSDERIGKETKSRYSNIIAEAEKLKTVEEKRAFIIGKIGGLYNEFLSQQEKVSNLEKERPGILRKYVELFNQAIGLGNQFTTGIDNEALIGYNDELIHGILNAQKQLKEYLKTLKDVPPPPPAEEPFDRKAEEEKLKKAKDAFEQYADLQSEASKQQFIKNNEFLKADLTSFEEYLVKRYQLAKSYGEKILLEEAASSVGTTLVRNNSTPVKLQSKGSSDSDVREFLIELIPKLSPGSINTLKYELEKLNEEIDKETDDARLKDLNKEKEILEEKLKQKRNTAKEEKRIYNDLLDSIQDTFGRIELLGYKTLENLKDKTLEIIESAKIENPEEGPSFVLIDIKDVNEQGKTIQKQVKLTIEEFNRLKEKYNEMDQLSEQKNPFKALSESFTNLKASLKSGDKKEFASSVESFNSAISHSINIVNEWSDALGEIFGEEVAKDIGVITDLAEGVTDLGTGIAQIASGDIVGGITNSLKGVAKIYTTLTKGNKEFRKEQREFLNELIDLQIKYNAVLNEQIRLQGESNVFLKDYAASALNASKALTDAQGNFNKTLGDKSLSKFLSDLDIKIGSKKKKFLGITTGSKDVFGSLLEKYPELIDQNGQFNAGIAETVLTLKDIPKETEQGLNALIEYQNQVEANEEAIKNAIEGIAGSLGSDLYSALTDAWDAGTDSFLAFKDTVSKGLKDIVSQLLFNEIFASSFDKLQANLKMSFGEAGDQDVYDDISQFIEGVPEKLNTWENGMDNFSKAAEEIGLNFNTDASSSESGIAGQISRVMTQDSATEIYGLWNGMYDTSKSQLRVQEEMLGIMRGGVSLPNGSALDTTEIENQSPGLRGSESLKEQLQVQKDSMAILGKIENNTRDTATQAREIAENTEVIYDVVGKLNEVKEAIESNGSPSGSNRRDQGW